MLIGVWVAVTVASAWSQHTLTRVQHDGANFEWGWQLASPGEASRTAGQYFVTSPQSKQHIRYAADGSGDDRAAAVNASDLNHSHSTQLVPGQTALDPNGQQAPQIYPNSPTPTPRPTSLGNINAQPVDIYLLQQQFTSPSNPQQIVHIPNNVQYSYITPLYNIRTQHPIQNQAINYNKQPLNEARFSENVQSSNPLHKEVTAERTVENALPVLQVFKNHNCSDDSASSETISKELENDLRKSKELFAAEPVYNNFGAKESNRSITYRGAVHFRVETPRPHARNERYYYKTNATPTTVKSAIDETQEGIDKLVASTQDLISNEDLLRLNHAIEKHIQDQTSEVIIPRRRINFRAHESRKDHYGVENTSELITINDDLRNIVRSDIEYIENNQSEQQLLQTNSDKYKFATPIIVADPSNRNYRGQVVNNLVSTVVPYIENGYEIVGVKNTFEQNGTDFHGPSREEVVNVTPRPLGQNYLAPITVALRLLNANDTNIFNQVEDPETSDSELISETIERPEREKTTVEIQESVPLEITHLNDVEVHEYLDEGRSNDKGPLDAARSLYNKYVEALKSSKIIQDNMNKILYKYGSMNNYEDRDDKENVQDYSDPKENLESSENIQTNVEMRPQEEETNNERSEYAQYYNDYGTDQKIIQPIIIEKEVPITKFVDRYIERQVLYPERVEVQVPVDRPVPVQVPVEKVVEKPVEVTRYVDKPYPVEISRPYPVEVKVPYPVEHKVYVDRPVHVPYPVEKVVEKHVVQHVPVPTPVGVPIGVPVEHKVLYPITIEKPVPYAVQVEKPVTVEKIVHKEIAVPYPVETKVPYAVPYETKVAVPYPVETKIPVPVEKIVEKPVTVTKYIEKPVHIEVPVPKPYAVPVRVPQPYPVDRIVEKKVPYPVRVDRIVEKKVPVHVPYPVEKVVEKIVEKPVVVTKYVDKPYPVEKRVPYPVDRIVEKRIPYPVQVEVKVPYPVDRIVEKPIHIPVAVYRYVERGEESRNNIQYQKSETLQQDQARKSQAQQMQAEAFAAQYYQHLKDRQQKNKPPIQSTHWGNQYASSYQYANSTPEIKHQELKKNQNLTNYLNYLRNAQNSPYQYYGRIPLQNQNNKNNYIVELKLRRTDRVPKVSNLNIEYGFKPPLIPSTEVDLDGVPVNKEN